MNHITIIGNLTKDPELRTTRDGIPVCGFTVAVDRRKTQKNKENNTEPGVDYFNVTAWRGLGENCAKFLNKGKKVSVVGRISLRTWETETKHGASLEVLAEDVEFLSPKDDGDGFDDAHPANVGASAPRRKPTLQPMDDDGDIPF